MSLRKTLNQNGVTIIDTLVVSGALVATGLTALHLYRQTTQNVGIAAGRLAVYGAMASIERRIVHSCMPTLFDYSEDMDRALPREGQSKDRIAIDGLRRGKKIQVSGVTVSIDSITLKHRRYVGRDISLASFAINASMVNGGETVSIKDEVPVFVRVSTNPDADPQAVDCTAVTNDQTIEGLAFLGNANQLAEVYNHSELFNLIQCLMLAGGLIPCDAGNLAWGANPETGEPATAPPLPPGVFEDPIAVSPVPGRGRTIAHIPIPTGWHFDDSLKTPDGHVLTPDGKILTHDGNKIGSPGLDAIEDHGEREIFNR